ncbi:flagellar biosynthesis protein FlhF [Campylobacterota bacterium]|nr:flagellar biosynthesis protein FlhF [Campylobacterota bacterium]
MKLFTYTGETVAAILKEVEVDWGGDANVVSTKEIRKKSSIAGALYEIVIGIEDEKAALKKSVKEVKESPRNANDGVRVEISKITKEIDEIMRSGGIDRDDITSAPKVKREEVSASRIEPQTAIKRESKIEQPATNEKANDLELLKQDIKKIADRVKLIQNSVWDKNFESKKAPPIPPEFAEIYRVSKQSGMSADHIDEIMRLTLENMPLSMRQSSETVRRYFNVLLRKMAPVRIESRLAKPNKKILMLVGPTGVGKTTTVAKLAARYMCQLPEKYRVGIINLDTYRIGAMEQLTYYAKLMRIGAVETVKNPIDFSAALSSLRDCDIILIDTTGCSQHDREKIARTQQFLDSDKQSQISVALVLSANGKLEDLRDTYRNYSNFGIDTIIVTKLDETNSIGSVFSLIHECKKPLSYFSIGQEVPEDIMPANADYFVSCLLDGFRKEREILK